MRYLTAGESHGKGLTAILEGFPAGVHIDCAAIDAELRRRQCGYGRGGRMKIESDHAEITAGLIGSVTLGSPISFFIRNRDFESWKQYTDPVEGDLSAKKVTALRPGHADYAGCIKYGFSDARPVLERASARETAARMGVGAFCKQLLAGLDIYIGSHVRRIGEVCAEVGDVGDVSTLNTRADGSPVRCLDADASACMTAAIDDARAAGDTLGGEIEVVVSGMPIGIGSYAQYDRKLDAVLAAHLMSIQAFKSVEVGLGHAVAAMPGSRVHDEILPSLHGIRRSHNHAGGIEGGMSNGEPIVLRCAVKPIPTLMRGLATVDTETGEPTTAHPERSDVCAVPAAGVVAEAAVAFALADELLRVTGGDTFEAIAERVEILRERSL